MPPKKKDPPPAGQRSIAAFFSPKLAGPKDAAAATASKLSKPAGAADTAAAKATAADGSSKAPLCASAKPLVESNVPVEVAVPAAAKPAGAAQAASGSAASSAADIQQLRQQAPAQASGSSPAAAAGKAGAALVGRGIKVYWADDKDWYEGTITAYDGTKHKVAYEDGDEEWVDLASEKYKLLQGKKGAAAKKRKAQVIESEDDGESAPDSGSDYQASMEQDEASEEESLADEANSESDTSPAPGKAKPSAGRAGKGGASANSKVAAGAKSTPGARAGAKGKKQASATPNGVAVDSGGLGLTPSGTAAAAGAAGGKPSVSKPAGAAAAVGTAGRPPRPPGTAAKTPGVKTPGTAGVKTPASALRSALDGGTPGSAAGAAATPGSTLKEAMAADAERFSARDAARFTFLHPNNIRDGNRRRPGEPGYDPSTVYVPPDWLKANKVSEGQKQWWEFKSRHYDAVLLFKMGKFYEMFEMDAHVGAEVLGLSYMKGDQPHCGFPEAAYHQMAETLARAGRRVVVIEQTETPDQLAARNEERRRQGLKKEMVVRRERVAVLTRGTLTDPEMLGAHPDAVFLMSVAELPVPSSHAAASKAQEEGSGVVRPRVWLGACAVDVATGQVLLGQWLDDDMRSQLRSVVTALQPAELVLPRGEISGSTRKVLLGLLRNPRLNELPLGPRCWDAPTAWQHLETGGYFGQGGAAMPAVLEAMLADRDGYEAAGSALGGCLAFLKDAMLDKQVLSAGRVELLSEAFGVGAGGSVGGGEQGPAYMALDGAALENLEVLENGDGGLQGTLLAAVDNCVTPAGRRRLRQWLCRPLFRIADITERQDAVHDLTTVSEEAAAQARKLFAGLSDLERALARLTAAGSGHGSAREAPHVVLYEDVARKRVQGFAAVLRGLHRIQEAMQLFQDLGDDLSSSLLRQLTTPGEGLFPDMEAALQDMREATDWDEAETSGRVVPRQGVDEAFDEAEGAIAVAEGNLQEYLQEVRRSVKGCSAKEINYVSLNKDSHVLEVPEGAGVPRDWEPMQGKKGWKRYMSEDLRQLAKELAEAQEQRERAMSGILQGLMALFAERKEVWAAAVDCTAQLDALMSLAVAAACSGGPMCRPTLVPWSPADGGSPVFRARGLCHPAGLSGSGGVFVPNDVQLGGDSPPFVVLTGPNMGGKSTLLRQACLACLLAQVGGWVPADSLELSPVDSVYVRMGARDRIMLGQSTFFVELAETSAALNRATPRSLVALDELGRGTATSDGAAIAAAVLDFLAKTVKCRGLFATHYHRLSDSHAADPDVALMHMACEVTPAGEQGGVDEVTFLYKLVPGPCPKSYGVNVARLAGLPDSVVRRAAQVAEQLEHQKGLPAATQAAPVEVQQQQRGDGGAQPMDLDGSDAAAGERGREGKEAALLQRAVSLAQRAQQEGGLPREELSRLQAEARQLAGVAC